jgi:hypothetical protein
VCFDAENAIRLAALLGVLSDAYLARAACQ